MAHAEKKMSLTENSTSLGHFDTIELLNELQNRVLPAERAVGASTKLHSQPPRSDPDEKKHHLVKVPGFEFSEHMYLGDKIYLLNYSGEKVKAEDWVLRLENGVGLTYGKISGLAGDFYGTDQPISDGTDFEDSMKRFRNAFDLLAKNTDRTPTEIKEILGILQEEIDLFHKAVKEGVDPWVAVWPHLPDVTDKLWDTTFFRPFGQPSYYGLATINWDHFGDDAHTAYKAGHQAAINVAISKKTDRNLELAYTMNAFADHYLQDTFAGGHLRTPRRVLHGSTLNPTPDKCAQYMHDEDCAIGLFVNNEMDDKRHYRAYGDKRLYSKGNNLNREYCEMAMQLSATEIYNSWNDQQSLTKFAALRYAPTISSALDENDQELKPLFVHEGGKVLRRTDITDRTDETKTSDFSYSSTAWDCNRSKKWDFPEPHM